MPNTPRTSSATEAPLICEENGELSLHFNFPTIQSRMLKSDPTRLILDYTRTMMGFLLLLANPERIAMIGLGGGSLAKYCSNKLPETDFTSIEVSADVIALRNDFGIPPDNSKFRIICADGAEFVRRETGVYDVLLVDGFDHSGQPEQLCSSFFYDNCYTSLRPRGILVVNLCADDPLLENYLSRLDVSFDGQLVLAEADEGENMIVFACKGISFPPKLSEITERLRLLELQHPVDLDKTAQKIVGRSLKRNRSPKKRR
ncbi:MAG: transferase [Betaproteobacteria bacterium]